MAEAARSVRVVHVACSIGFAGVERSMITSAVALAERGHHVTVIGGSPEHMAKHLSGSAVSWEPAATIADAVRALRQHREADVVHAHMTEAELAVALTRPFLRRATFVASRHFAGRRGATRSGRLASLLVERLHPVEVAVSGHVADRIGVPSTVVYHGVASVPVVPLDRPQVLVVQRLEAEKDTATAIRAWSRSGLGDRGWTLLIAGDGAERSRLELLAHDEGVVDSVRFLGHVSALDELRHEVSIQLSTTPVEAFGLAVAEAMAAGVPVVAADGCAHPELVGADRDGLLFPPGDADAAARLLVELADDPERRRRIGARLQARQRAEFSTEAHGHSLEALYLTARGTTPDRPRTAPDELRVLRVYHSGVVSAWRERDRALRRRGVDVTLVSPARWDEGGKVVELDEGDDDFIVTSRTIGTHPYLFLYDPRPLWRLLRRSRFDVLDVHEEPASLAVLELRILARLARQSAPMLVYGAQNIDKTYPIPFRWMERSSLRHVAGAYPCNAEAGEIYRRKGFGGVVSTIGLGIDLSRFFPDERAPEPGRFRVGYVGRLEAHKGVDTAIRAVGATAGTELAVYGDGPERDRLERLVAELGLTDRVVFHGFARHDDLPAVYRSFDALVVPSRTFPNWMEQFGRVAVEAMASGVPVVVSRSGALPEVVGDAGLTAPEGDVAAWAAALVRLAGEPGVRKDLALRGRERAEQYSWDRIAETHHRLYAEVTA